MLDTQKNPHHQEEKEKNAKDDKGGQVTLVVLGNAIESYLGKITTIVPTGPCLVELELLKGVKDTLVIVETTTQALIVEAKPSCGNRVKQIKRRTHPADKAACLVIDTGCAAAVAIGTNPRTLEILAAAGTDLGTTSLTLGVAAL